MKQAEVSLAARLEREVERERRERELLDEQRTGFAPEEDFRIKDARENKGAFGLKRRSGR